MFYTRKHKHFCLGIVFAQYVFDTLEYIGHVLGTSLTYKTHERWLNTLDGHILGQ